MIIKSNKTLVNNWYAHTSFLSSISNKRVCHIIVEEEVIWVESLWISTYPLSWWESNQHLYPLLNKHLLHIPSTTVPSERSFSTARDIVTAQRAYVLSTYVDMPVGCFF